MPIHTLPYGPGFLSLDFLTSTLPANTQIDWIEPEYVGPAPDPLAVVRGALKNPAGGRTIPVGGPDRTVAIAVNDKTRPVPHEYLLPPLLAELLAAHYPESAVQFIIATGTHTPMPPEDYARVLPEEILLRYRVNSHNCDDLDGLVYLDRTSRGTPIYANRDFMQADLRIVVGNIEPHHFAGFSGGYKTAAIGLAGRETINHNHAMLVEPQAKIAAFGDNPLRQDIEEIGRAMRVDFALNAVLNGEKKIVQAVAGDPESVMRAGIPISQGICQIPSTGRYDLVVASVGGAPKDINFYQSQKALTHASLFTRDGGVIILAAACPEGTGSQAYETFMEGVETPQAVFEKFRQEGFRVGPHKAFQVARDAARVHIILVSDIPGPKIARLLMAPAASLEEAVAKALAILTTQEGAPTDPLRVAVLPRATNTIPIH